MKKIHVIILLVLVIAGGVFLGSFRNRSQILDDEQDFVLINGQRLNIELVQTRSDIVRGLSGRESLDRDTGMLFVFDKSDKYSFWMKEMKFPIDIIWISEYWQVVEIHHSVAPDSFPQSFSTTLPARYVLEVNAGVAKDLGLSVGDKIERD